MHNTWDVLYTSILVQCCLICNCIPPANICRQLPHELINHTGITMNHKSFDNPSPKFQLSSYKYMLNLITSFRASFNLGDKRYNRQVPWTRNIIRYRVLIYCACCAAEPPDMTLRWRRLNMIICRQAFGPCCSRQSITTLRSEWNGNHVADAFLSALFISYFDYDLPDIRSWQ